MLVLAHLPINNSKKMAKDEIKAGEVAETEVTAPALRKYQEKIKGRYADFEPQKDEDWLDMMDKYAEETDGELSKYKGASDTISETMKADPAFGQLVYDVVVNKIPLAAAIAKHFSQEDLIPQEGEPDYEEYSKQYSARKEKAEKMSAMEKEIEQNEQATLASIDSFCESKGYSDEQKTNLIDSINEFFNNLLMKKIEESMLDYFHKMLNYDTDMQATAEAARIEGRNEAIEVKKGKDQAAVSGDGVPQISGGSDTQPQQMKQPNKLFSDIRERKSI